MAKKKIPIKDFVVKLRDAVIQLVRTTKELQKSLEDTQSKISSLENKIGMLEKRISLIEENLTSSKPMVAPAPTPERESIETEVSEEPEFVDLMRELGLETSAEEEIPSPPPAIPVETVVEKPKEPERKPAPSLPSTLGMKEMKKVEEEDLKKEKDELLKALEDLDII